MDLSKVRNIGISAHIDSGKTTLSERILFYSGRIHKMEEVREGGATMDFMELEQERGITITSAATFLKWNDHELNLIDTPGHVDFTVEVERSLRVLDGAILVLCGVGGVQAQSLTVDRQMKRYHVPRLAFINKLDRTGANPLNVVKQIRGKLGCDAVMMQLPIGLGDKLEGVIDLFSRTAHYFDGKDGERIRREPVPAELQADVEKHRQEMLEAIAMYSDQLMELLLGEQDVPEALFHDVVRQAVQQQELTPVFMGSAFRNKGVQLLLDAVTRYLPSPLDRQVQAKKYDNPDEQFGLLPDPAAPLVAMAFKIVDDPYGQLTFMRVYQGKIEKGQLHYNQRTGKKERFSRIVKMHADKREEVSSAQAGDIVAVMGVDGASGDTYSSQERYCTLENMYIPEPVIKVAVSAASRADSDKLSKALARFRREDPTFQISQDEETGEILMAGMGELHLEIYTERIRREYGVDVEVSPPKVSYREAPTQATNFDYKHKKQTGGSGQYAHIIGRMEPLPEDTEELFIFEEEIIGGRIPKQYVPSIEKGLRSIVNKGPVAEYPVVRLKVVVTDGSYHDVDSSDRAFQTCAVDCFREYFPRTKPVLLEPIMKMDIEVPEEYQGAVTGDISARRGIISSSEVRNQVCYLTAEVPLQNTFGYVTDLRSMTQGKGVFAMELLCYRPVPSSLQAEIIEERRKQKKGQLVGAK